MLLRVSSNRHRLTLEIRCSEIASEAILGPNRSRSSYMACRVLHPIFGCPYSYAFADINFSTKEDATVRKTAGGVTDEEIEHDNLASC